MAELEQEYLTFILEGEVNDVLMLLNVNPLSPINLKHRK